MDDAPVDNLFGQAVRPGWDDPASAARGTQRYHVDLGLVALLVAIYDIAIVGLTGWLALLPRPVLLVPSYLVTVLIIALAVLYGWALPRGRNRETIDRFVARPLWRRGLLLLAGYAVLFGVPALVVYATLGADEPLFAWIAAWAIMAFGGSLGLRAGLTFMIAHWRREGALRQTIAIVGSGDLAVRLIVWLRQVCADSVEVIGVFDDRQRHDPSHVHFSGVLMGTTDDLVQLSRASTIDRVIVALPHSAEQRLMRILRKLRRIPVDICLAPDQVGFAAAVISPGDYSGLPVVKVYGRPLEGGHRLAKAAFDRGFAALALILCGPLMLCIAAKLKFRDKRPVLTAETRLGVGTRTIKILCFRHDEATALGRALQRSGLHLLPRLLNVLKGDLSVVGPRAMAAGLPVAGRLDQEIVEEYALRHRVKPGLTGWAQINGYDADARTPGDLLLGVQHDLHYIDHWSLWLDVKILGIAAFRMAGL